MNRPSISELQELAFQNAMEKGWHDEPVTTGEKILLMHSELSEATEKLRNHRRPDEIYYSSNLGNDHNKPEGIPIELADCVIRIFDFCGFYGIDLESAIVAKMAYNKTRSRRHGGKKL